MKNFNLNYSPKAIRKKLFGLFLIALIFNVFSSSVEDNIVPSTVETLVSVDLCEMVHADEKKEDAPKAKKPEKIVTAEKTTTSSFLQKRYAGMKLYPKHDYIESVIAEYGPKIKKQCQKEGINYPITMAQFIIECVKPSERSLSELATKSHNYFSIKHKKDCPNMSEEFKSVLKQAAKSGTHKLKDDEYVKEGAMKILVPSDFYIFKSTWWGIRASVGFIADRVKTHPQYMPHFKGVSPNDNKAWAYALYNSGYARKNPNDPYDKKLVRLVKQYDLK